MRLSPQQRLVLGAFANPGGPEDEALRERERRMGRGMAQSGFRKTLASLIRHGLIQAGRSYVVTEKGRRALGGSQS